MFSIRRPVLWAFAVLALILALIWHLSPGLMYFLSNQVKYEDSFESFLEACDKSDVTVSVRLSARIYRCKKSTYGYVLYGKNVCVQGSTGDSGHAALSASAGIGANASEGGAASMDVLIYSDREIAPGSDIYAEGRAELIDGAMNMGQFDKRLYYRTLGIGYALYADKIISQGGEGVYHFLKTLAYRLENAIYTVTDETTASVMCAMLLGDKENLDDEMYELYSDCGIGHILAISGLHISLIGMGLYRFLKNLGLRKRFAAVLGIVTMILYGFMTGNAVSTVRAIIMLGFIVYADLTERTYDALTALGFAGIVMLTDSPLLICNSGFQLSFSAVIGVVVIGGALKSIMPPRSLKDNDRRADIKRRSREKGKSAALLLWLYEFKSRFLDAFFSSLAIFLATMPIIMYWYYKIPTYSVLLNLIVIPLLTVVVLSAIGGALGGLASPVLGRFLIGPGVFVLAFFEALCRSYIKIPGSILVTGRPGIWQIAAYYMLMGAFASVGYMIGKRRKYGKCAGLYGASAAFISMALVAVLIRFESGFMIDFLYVGQGAGVFIRTEKGTTIVYDMGSTTKNDLYDNTFLPYLHSQGITRVDYVFVSHTDRDHYSAVLDMMKDGKISVGTLCLPCYNAAREDDGNYEALAKAAGETTDVREVYAGCVIREGDFTLSCIYPEKGVEIADKNAASTVSLITYAGQRILLTGDISSEQEEALTGDERIRDLTILASAHHGSRTANSHIFLEYVNAKQVVISSGINNSYGHPHKETLERLAKAGLSYICTMERGQIRYRIGADGTVTVETYR